MNQCQRGLGSGCTKKGTHEIVIEGRGTGVLMCGPHARDAVLEYMRQGEKSVSMRQVAR